MTHQHLDIARLIRQQGFRFTPQRQLILDAVCEGGGHTTFDEIYNRVSARTPAINRATVYRTLQFLERLRLVVSARIGGETVYEIGGEAPHHHLVCQSCGQMIQIDQTALKPLLDEIERQHQFTLDPEHLALFGLCHECREG